jgi:hypothetical protein
MLRFEVRGVPVPQGSVRAFIHKGPKGPRALVAQTSKTLRSWRAEVTDAAMHHLAAELKDAVTFPKGTAVAVGLIFRMPLINGYLGTHGVTLAAPLFTFTPPDRDKLVRGVGDALTTAGLVWNDDCQDAVGMAARLYVPPGSWTGAVVLLGVAETEYEAVILAGLAEVQAAKQQLLQAQTSAASKKQDKLDEAARLRAEKAQAVKAAKKGGALCVD